MSVPGIPLYWTKPRLDALAKVAHKANTGDAHLDWGYARTVLFRESKLLKGKTNNQLSKAWCLYKKVLEGTCYASGCHKPRDTDALLCPDCRKREGERAKGAGDRVYMTPILKRHEKIALEIIQQLSREFLLRFAIDHLYEFPIKVRKNLLGESFKNIVKIKRGGRRKK